MLDQAGDEGRGGDGPPALAGPAPALQNATQREVFAWQEFSFPRGDLDPHVGTVPLSKTWATLKRTYSSKRALRCTVTRRVLDTEKESLAHLYRAASRECLAPQGKTSTRRTGEPIGTLDNNKTTCTVRGTSVAAPAAT